MTPGADPVSSGTTARTILIMTALAEAPDAVSVVALAEQLGLPAGTTHRLLQRLCEQGIATWHSETKRYSVGGEFVRLARLILNGRRINDIALPILQALVADTGESVLMATLNRRDLTMSFVEHVQAPRPLRFVIDESEPVPLIWGSLGRVMLAYLSPEEIESAVAHGGSPPVPGAPARSAKSILASLARIREVGSEDSGGETIPHVCGMSAPIFGANGDILASIGFTIPEVRYVAYDHEELRKRIRAAAKEVSSHLGHDTSVVAKRA